MTIKKFMKMFKKNVHKMIMFIKKCQMKKKYVDF